MTHEVIISRATDFTADGALEQYMALENVPNMDIWMPDVQTIILGYNKVILLGEDGRTRFAGYRCHIKGLAVDGEAIPVHGDNFKRIRIEGNRKANVEGATTHVKLYKVILADTTQEFDSYADAKAFYDANPGAILAEEDITKHITWTRDIEEN